MRIDIRLAERIKKLSPSATLAITSKAKSLKELGRDVVNFAGGEPDFDTPDFIKEKACEAIKSGFTKYTPSAGIPELKLAISEKFRRDNQLNYTANQIVVSSGAKHSIFNSLFVLVDEGDEVLIPSPYWVSYPEMVNLCSGSSRFITTYEKNNFKITAGDLEKNINSKTKVFILNSPSNPVGCVYNEKELKEIAEVCIAKKIFVISDEVYEKLIYDGLKHISLASLGKDINDLTITVNGVSKAYAMTGWRIGYLAGPLDIVEAIEKLQDHSTSNPTSISQKAALAALKAGDDFSKDMLKEFQKRRDYLLEELDKVPKIKYIKPQGAFYIFCNISKTGLDAKTFASRLLEEALVAVIPSEGFGIEDHIRISFSTSLAEIQKGVIRLRDWVSKL